MTPPWFVRRGFVSQTNRALTFNRTIRWGSQPRLCLSHKPGNINVLSAQDGRAGRTDHCADEIALKAELRSLTNGLPARTNVCTRRKRTCGAQGGSPGLTASGIGRHLMRSGKVLEPPIRYRARPYCPH